MDKNNSSNNYYQYNSAEKSGKENKNPVYSIKKTLVIAVVICSIFSLIAGLGGGYFVGSHYKNARTNAQITQTQNPDISTEKPSAGKNDASPVYSLSDSTNKYGSISRIYDNTVEAVVGIEAQYRSTGVWNSYSGTGSGSGVVISSDGYIITNNHVISQADRISVTLNDENTYEAQLVGLDVQFDIAVLKIPVDNLKYLSFGDSDKTVVGEQVLVIGNPLGYLANSLTVGYISGLQREITLDNEKMILLQTDAAVNPGNSGGAMINMKGELIGIINAKSYGSEIDGIGFAIPINDVKDILDDIVNYGYVKGRPFIGITVREIPTETALNWYNMMYDLKLKTSGLYITTVEQSAPADQAGLKQWDRMISFNGIITNEIEDLKSQIDDLIVGQVVEVIIERDGSEMTIMLTIGEENPTTPKG